MISRKILSELLGFWIWYKSWVVGGSKVKKRENWQDRKFLSERKFRSIWILTVDRRNGLLNIGSSQTKTCVVSLPIHHSLSQTHKQLVQSFTWPQDFFLIFKMLFQNLYIFSQQGDENEKERVPNHQQERMYVTIYFIVEVGGLCANKKNMGLTSCYPFFFSSR
jgi:hypothetical protein